MFKRHTRIIVNNYIDSVLEPPKANSGFSSVW